MAEKQPPACRRIAWCCLRADRVSWWQEEMPNSVEYYHAMDTLDGVGLHVDYVITHAAPTSVLQTLRKYFEPDASTDFLEVIRSRLSFTHWYFGHYHVVRDVGEKFNCLYENVIALNDGREQTDG